MTLETLEKKRKRLIFRSWHRGTREMDLIMGSFADQYVPEFTPEELDRYEEVLQNSDLDVYDWVCGRTEVPANKNSDIVEKLLKYDYAAALQKGNVTTNS